MHFSPSFWFILFDIWVFSLICSSQIYYGLDMLQVTHDSSQSHNNTNSSFFILEIVTDSSDGNNISYYLTVYALFAGLNSVFTLFRAFLFAYGGIHAATNVHKRLLKTIIKVSTIVGWKLVKLNFFCFLHQTKHKISSKNYVRLQYI
jgi:hypothetical protein